MMKPPMTATHRGSGTGMGNTKTFLFGASKVNAPPTAKTAPDAPMTRVFDGPSSMKKKLPIIPQRK